AGLDAPGHEVLQRQGEHARHGGHRDAQRDAARGGDPGGGGPGEARGGPPPPSPHSPQTAAAAPSAPSTVPVATSPSLAWPSSCATTDSTSAGGASRRSVSYTTIRRVGPRPDTYALTALVRRDASATSTSRTGTPSRWASAMRSSRSGPASIGVNRLKIGSTITGS